MAHSLTLPNEIYYKGRRFSVLSSALLFLAIYVGLVPSATDSGSTIFSLTLNNPDYLSTIFFFVALYAVWQFWTAWYVQTMEVRNYIVNQADCFITGILSLSSIVSFFYKFPVSYFWLILAISLLFWCLAFFVGAQKLHSVISEKVKKKDLDIYSTLNNSKWRLLFDPDRKTSKIITFLDDGNISDGKNDNENTWRPREGLLEILNKEGKVFSRFRYNPSLGIFEHTNDDDTLSIRHQKISRVK